jgi:hypothetical protein
LTPNGDPYEYTITVAAAHVEAIRRALGATRGQDAFEAILANSREIMRQGETTWLDSLHIPYKLDRWAPWVEISD